LKQLVYFFMENPLYSLGYKVLNASLEAENVSDPLRFSKLSRRGFLMLAASLSSCAAAETSGSIKTVSNTNYRTPKIQENLPPLKVSSAKESGITFTRVDCPGNYIAITFDDGPHSSNTPRLLEMLRQRNIKATFYLVGQNVNLYPQIVRQTVAEGHELGNHTQTHRLLSKLSDAEVRSELSLCRDAIGRAAGVQPRTMRPPYGGLTQRQREMVKAEFGYPTILWSVDPLDWKRPGAAAVTSRILSGSGAGGIILAHDIHSQTIDAMPATLDSLIKRGFKFVTVSQLLAMQTATPAAATPSQR
jgi:peptidoglycan-N-acetylglucosamine deacetylase